MAIASDKPTLVADIGGTNSRFALAYIKGNGDSYKHYAIENLVILPTNEYESLHKAAFKYLHDVTPNLRPDNAVLAVAAPVVGEQVTFSNVNWECSASNLQSELNIQKVYLLNDFAAIASAVPYLNGTSIRQIGGGEKQVNQPMVVLGPGTGLGVSALVHIADRWHVIPSEGGQTSFSPRDDLECEILKMIHKEFPRVSVERLLSGQGLSLIYTSLSKIQNKDHDTLQPEEITKRAIAGSDDVCKQVLDIFCAALGNFACDIAMTFNATGGVYLAGGVLSQIQDLFVSSRFRERFEEKGRLHYVKDIPTYLIVEQQPALIGAALWAKQNIYN